jgi:thiamine-phosphate pyrophosphorylase
MNCKREDLKLYAVTDRHWLNGETLYSQIEKAIAGGCTFVQLREKNLSHEEFVQEALEVQKLCRENKIPFIINDDVSIAKDIDADGVHVGQGDMDAMDVRRILGADKIIGVSAHTVEQALKAEQQGADYLGVGAVFETGSKSDAQVISHDTLRQICQAVSIPVIAIGGITKENISQLSGTGVCGVAVISAIFGQPDIKQATKELRKNVEDMVNV